ncbi:hypothetical protein EVAR_68407_1 [Eumeta japonica]|uniref:Uncharacterized protein n=1 Tax=Eumeta variegata TaxID=151549 RepID=A0A4C2A503_EUMVA|nr:hypothetical protein EVAR_68407_1 [Eumeta japonica]
MSVDKTGGARVGRGCGRGARGGRRQSQSVSDNNGTTASVVLIDRHDAAPLYANVRSHVPVEAARSLPDKCH